MIAESAGRPNCAGYCDPPQVQPVRRRGRLAGARVARVELLARARGRRAPLPDRQQQADDVAHHVVQERIGGDVDREPIAAARHPQRVQPPHRRARLALGGAKRAEVVLADQRLRRLPAWRRASSGRCTSSARPRRQRRARDAVEDQIAVGARERADSAHGSDRAPRAPSSRLMSRGRWLLAPSSQARSAAHAPWCRNAPPAARACTPASVRPAQMRATALIGDRGSAPLPAPPVRCAAWLCCCQPQ